MIPTTAQPGRTTQQLPTISDQPARIGEVEPDEEELNGVPANADKLFLILKGATFTGNKAYTDAELEEYFKPYYGQRISLLKVYQLAHAITAKYRNAGYMLATVSIPPQKITRGYVKLRVLEGEIHNVQVISRVSDSLVGRSRLLREMGENIAEHNPVQKDQLERDLLLMNSLPGVEARAVLKPSSKPGATDAIIITNQKRVTGYLQADNRGSRYLGPLQGTAVVKVNGVTDASDALAVSVNGTAQRAESHGYGVNYQRVLLPNGLTANVGWSDQATEPGYLLKDFDVKGRDRSLVAGISYPLTLTRKERSSVYVNATSRDVRSDVLGTTLSKDHIRAVRAGYNRNDSDFALGRDREGFNTMNIEVAQGISAFGSSKRGAVTSQPDAAPDFTKVNATISREQHLKKSNWSAFGSVTGQYATKTLLTPEKFGVGGEQFGSAYDSSEVLGDSGFAVRGEARYLVIPQSEILGAQAIQPYAFYDFGMVFDRNPAAGQKQKQSLASAGVGVRAEFNYGFSVSIEAAQPLNHEVAALRDKDLRLFVKVGKTF